MWHYCFHFNVHISEHSTDAKCVQSLSLMRRPRQPGCHSGKKLVIFRIGKKTASLDSTHPGLTQDAIPKYYCNSDFTCLLMRMVNEEVT